MTGRNAGIDHFDRGTLRFSVLSVLYFGVISKLESVLDAKLI